MYLCVFTHIVYNYTPHFYRQMPGLLVYIYIYIYEGGHSARGLVAFSAPLVEKLIGGVGIGAYWGLLGSAGPAKPGSGRLLELRSLSLSRLGPALGQALPVWFGSAWHASA